MTAPKVNWSEFDQKYWVATDEEPLWFENSLDAKHAARQIEIDNAVKAEREAIVAWLRAEAQLCDCFAREDGECACGAWDTEVGERSYKRVYIEDIADAIEARAHLGRMTNPASCKATRLLP
jgi:hypothetical protein